MWCSGNIPWYFIGIRNVQLYNPLTNWVYKWVSTSLLTSVTCFTSYIVPYYTHFLCKLQFVFHSWSVVFVQKNIAAEIPPIGIQHDPAAQPRRIPGHHSNTHHPPQTPRSWAGNPAESTFHLWQLPLSRRPRSCRVISAKPRNNLGWGGSLQGECMDIIVYIYLYCMFIPIRIWTYLYLYASKYTDRSSYIFETTSQTSPHLPAFLGLLIPFTLLEAFGFRNPPGAQMAHWLPMVSISHCVSPLSGVCPICYPKT